MYSSTKNSLFDVGPPFILILTLWQGFWLSDFLPVFCTENICHISCLLISSTSGALSGRDDGVYEETPECVMVKLLLLK